MKMKDYNRLKNSIDDLIINLMVSDLVEAYLTPDDLYKAYTQTIGVWKIWIDEIIEFNEDYELCAKIKKAVVLYREANIRLAKKLRIYEDDMLESLILIEDIQFYEEEEENA